MLIDRREQHLEGHEAPGPVNGQEDDDKRPARGTRYHRQRTRRLQSPVGPFLPGPCGGVGSYDASLAAAEQAAGAGQQHEQQHANTTCPD